MANLKLWQSLGFAAQFAVGAAVPSPVARLTLGAQPRAALR